MLTMTEAAHASGVSKSTIHRAIKSGKLSAERGAGGEYAIDAAELSRVYKTVTHARDASVKQNETASEAVGTAPAVAALEAELRVLRERLDDLKTDRDAWRQQAERLTLTAPIAETKARPRRLFGLFPA
jgi:excisionase family DNA binding protein